MANGSAGVVGCEASWVKAAVGEAVRFCNDCLTLQQQQQQ